MINKLKNEIEKDFDREKNYNKILSKAEGESIMKKFKVIYALAPICVIIIAIIGFKNIPKHNIQNEKTHQWFTKEIYLDESEVTEDIAVVPHWEELETNQQYNEVEYNNNTYSSRNAKIESKKIEKELGTTALTGYDSYSQNKRKKDGKIYSIKDLPEECAIAIQFENDEDFYVYVNSYYKPKTLGELVEDLNLKDTISFGTVYYDYFETNAEGKQEYHNIQFYNVNNNDIWEMLFNDLTLKNTYDDRDLNKYGVAVISVSVDIELLGYKNTYISLTDKGYLETNILDTGKAFYIGEEKVQEFIDYVIDNYDGYKIVYKHKTDEQENNNKDNTILMYDNTTNTTSNVTLNSNSTSNSTPSYNPQND